MVFDKTLLARNIWLLYATYFLHALVMGYAVIQILYLQARDLTYFEISLLMAAGVITFTVVELFTGMFSDFYGRKTALLLSAILLTLSTFMFGFFTSFASYLIAAITVALAGSFCSGADDALMFESLRRLGRKKEYAKVNSRGHLIFVGLGIVTNFFIPIIFGWSIVLPYYVGALLGIILIIITFFMYDPLPKKRSWISHTVHFRNAAELILRKKYLLWLLFFSAAITISLSYFGDMVNQPYIEERYDMFMYGLLFAGATIVQSLILFYFENILNFISRRRFPLFLFAVWTLGLVIFSFSSGVILMLIMGFMWFVGAARSIFLSNEINLLVRDSERSTMHSVNSLVSSLAYLSFLPLLGLFTDAFTLQQTVYLLIALSVLAAVITLSVKSRFDRL